MFTSRYDWYHKRLYNLLDSPFIHYLQAPYIKIESDSQLVYDIDGEEGTTFPIEVSVEKQKLNIIVPK